MDKEVIPETTAVDIVVRQNPAVVFTDPETRNSLIDFLKKEVMSFVPDLLTTAGRKNIASLSYKVRQTKTAIDDAGKLLKSEHLKKCQEIDSARNELRDQLDVLAEEARRPLTEWETAEATRKTTHEKTVRELTEAGIIPITATAASVEATIERIMSIDTSPAAMQEYSEPALFAQRQAFGHLSAAVGRLEQAERDREELERLRIQAVQREEEDRIRNEQAERDRAERVKAELQLQESIRIANELAKQEEEARIRIERAREEAAAEAERTTRERIEREAEAERQQIQKKHDDELAEARRLQREAEEREEEQRRRIVQEEQDRLDAEYKQQQEAAAQKREDDRRERSRKHRAAIRMAAVTGILSVMHGDRPDAQEDAVRIVESIERNEIKNVTIDFTGDIS